MTQPTISRPSLINVQGTTFSELWNNFLKSTKSSTDRDMIDVIATCIIAFWRLQSLNCVHVVWNLVRRLMPPLWTVTFYNFIYILVIVVTFIQYSKRYKPTQRFESFMIQIYSCLQGIGSAFLPMLYVLGPLIIRDRTMWVTKAWNWKGRLGLPSCNIVM